jgi:hypothetical protein
MAHQLVIAAIPNRTIALHKLWRVTFLGDSTPLIQMVDDKLYGGDESNSAIFFGERYHDPSKTVDDLKTLAAHIILEGHKLSPSAIDGLELLESRDGHEPRLLEAWELAVLKTKSDAIHSGLVKDFFGEVRQ